MYFEQFLSQVIREYSQATRAQVRTRVKFLYHRVRMIILDDFWCKKEQEIFKIRFYNLKSVIPLYMRVEYPVIRH